MHVDITINFALQIFLISQINPKNNSLLFQQKTFILYHTDNKKKSPRKENFEKH